MTQGEAKLLLKVAYHTSTHVTATSSQDGLMAVANSQVLVIWHNR
jgi:hypothetical protein